MKIERFKFHYPQKAFKGLAYIINSTHSSSHLTLSTRLSNRHHYPHVMRLGHKRFCDLAEVIELVGRCQSQDANPGGLTPKTIETDYGSSETKAFPVPPIPELK